MFDLMLDVVKNRLFIELYGYFSIDHIREYVDNLNKLTNTIPSGRCSVLVIENRLDPLPQHNLPYMQEATYLLVPWAHKIAVVHGNRTITHMQMKKIVAEAKMNISKDVNIMRFKTKKDALDYLNWL